MSSLVRCRACGQKFSRRAESCPTCAEPLESKSAASSRRLSWLAAAFACAVLCFYVGAMAGYENVRYNEAVKEFSREKRYYDHSDVKYVHHAPDRGRVWVRAVPATVFLAASVASLVLALRR